MSVEDTRYIVYDIETVVDGALLASVHYADETVEPDEAIRRMHQEQRQATDGRSDFIPVSFHVPVAVGVARVGADFHLQDLTALDSPRHDPTAMVKLFWRGVDVYKKASLVDFNGRGFDIPVLSLAAFRLGISCKHYFRDSNRYGYRYRFSDKHLDLLDWVTEYGAFRLRGGLDLLAKMIGKPGKMDTRGAQVEALHREGKIEAINDYCLHDVLDTYFVFLRTRVLTGELTTDRETAVVAAAREWLTTQAATRPALATYVEGMDN